MVSLLSEGKYVLTEVVTPDGYERIEPVKFSVERVKGKLKFAGSAEDYSGDLVVGSDVESILKGLKTNGKVTSSANMKTAVVFNKSVGESGEAGDYAEPKTGDDFALYIWLTIMLAAMGIIITVSKRNECCK